MVEIAAVLRRLQSGPLAVLAGLNLVFLLLLNLRWWVLLRRLGWRRSLAVLFSYRLVGFGVSYLTPGPQFGGEPVQVHLLHRREGMRLEDAVTGVFLDRLVDLLANFSFLVVGSLALASSGRLPDPVARGIWMLAFGLLLLPVGLFIALSKGRQPLTWLTRRVRWGPMASLGAAAANAERQAARLIREEPAAMAAAFGLSALAWGAGVLEYWMSLRLLGVEVGWVEALSALTAARFAFLLPLPGGAGVLEASQVMAAQLFGWAPAAGIAVSLVIRARDFLLALVGAGLGAVLYRFSLFPWFSKRERS